MKIAVIGGNLLGCATTLDLALVQEYDQKRASDDDVSFEVTVIERRSCLGGNSLKSVSIDDDLRVEVGRYRTLPLVDGSYLHDLLSAANDYRGTVSMFGRRVRIPGATDLRRGSINAAKVMKPWQTGTHKRIIRRFGMWDWRDDAYHLVHSGWPLLDFLYRLFDNQLWRSLAFAGCLYFLRQLGTVSGQYPRAIVLSQAFIMLVIAGVSPKRLIGMWQTQYSFWGTTLPLLYQYGITPAIARGSTMGFLKHIADINQKNIATCAVSIGRLISRARLDPYVRGTGDDYVRKFKYDRSFVRHYMEPVVAWQYEGAKLTEVNSLASHLAMLDADFTDSDTPQRLAQISPDNAALCSALIEAARVDMDVNVQLDTSVAGISYDEITHKYVIRFEDGRIEEFDGVALCASPRDGAMEIDTPVGTNLSELLGYDRDLQTTEGHAAQEANYLAENEQEANSTEDCAVKESACSHFAVVSGVAKASFFRFNYEKQIPDLVQISHADACSRFERIREVGTNQTGVYTVLCGNDFVSGGVFNEMFEDGSEIRYYEKMKGFVYNHTALPMSREIDDCMPHLVLGNRFVYPAGVRKLAKHPELDAISALNCASLFSKAVQWTTEDIKNEYEEDDDE